MKTVPFEFCENDYPLAPLTMYRVGGPARLALLPRTESEAVEANQWLASQDAPRLILGKGSNVLISDDGFDGNVLVTIGLEKIEELGGHTYKVEGGLDLDRLVRDVMLPNNYDGVGAFAGIPGSVGGAIFMNAGTASGSTCAFIESVALAGPGGLRDLDMDESMYAYRDQKFCGPDDLIVSATFKFAPSDRNQQDIYDHYMQKRRETQPQGKCCGCVFKNPPNDHSARLIEACGLKGTRKGGAIISEVHANFIMNENNASFSDIMDLITLCKQQVNEKFGIMLKEEVRVIC